MNQLLTFTKEAQQEIQEYILPFWIEHAIDDEYGGFYGEVNSEGRAINHANKGVVLNARILWTFSAAYKKFNKRKYLETAERAYSYLINNFKDEKYGGYFWMLDHKGKPVNTRKQIYAQGFVIYGLSEYYRATGFKPALGEAQELFEMIEKYSYDPVYSGYFEAYSADWNPIEDMRLSAKDANEKKSMNTHLHILEPYTNLFRIWPDKLLKEKIEKLIEIFLHKIFDKKSGHLSLFFDEDWTVKSDLISFGHDIEAGWLLSEAAETIGAENMVKDVSETAVKLTELTRIEGTDIDHSIFYEASPFKITDDDKHWWVQGEAVVGYLNAYQISGDAKFLDEALLVWEFIQRFVSDKVNGEWHKIVTSSGKVKPDQNKVDAWKCPYHNSRTCLEIIGRINKIKKADS